MRTATQLDGKITEPQHPHPLAVFLAENGCRAGLDRLVEIHDLDVRIRVRPDFGIYQPLDFGQLLFGHGFRVGEVETKVIGGDQ